MSINSEQLLLHLWMLINNNWLYDLLQKPSLFSRTKVLKFLERDTGLIAGQVIRTQALFLSLFV